MRLGRLQTNLQRRSAFAVFVKMDIDERDSFKQAVYDIVRLVPRGRATSYAAIARASGYPAHSRLVGRMMAGCSDGGIPAHRVVNSQGVLSGRAAFGEPGRMQSLLEADGLTVENDRIKNWKHVFWNPQDEI